MPLAQLISPQALAEHLDSPNGSCWTAATALKTPTMASAAMPKAISPVPISPTWAATSVRR